MLATNKTANFGISTFEINSGKGAVAAVTVLEIASKLALKQQQQQQQRYKSVERYGALITTIFIVLC